MDIILLSYYFKTFVVILITWFTFFPIYIIFQKYTPTASTHISTLKHNIYNIMFLYHIVRSIFICVGGTLFAAIQLLVLIN